MHPLDVSCRSAGVVVVVVVAGGRLHSLMLDITTATRAERQRHCCRHCVHRHCMWPRHHEHQEQRFVVLFASRLSFTPCVSSFPTFIGALLRFVVFGRMGLSISVCQKDPELGVKRSHEALRDLNLLSVCTSCRWVNNTRVVTRKKTNQKQSTKTHTNPERNTTNRPRRLTLTRTATATALLLCVYPRCTTDTATVAGTLFLTH